MQRPAKELLGRLTLLACGMTIAAAAPAGADRTPAGDFDFQFSSTQPAAAAGLEFRQLYKNPDDPSAKPSAVERFLFAAPEGSVFDGSAVPACKASDEQLQLMGKAACPPASVVATGFITVMTGVPGERPSAADATVFNSGDGIIELFTQQDTGTYLASERPKFRGGNAFEDSEIAPTPGGPPDGRSAAREAYLKFPLTRGPGGRSFITTPRECPSSRRWTARFEWTNADGNGYSNRDDASCARTGPDTTRLGNRRGRRVSSRLSVSRCTPRRQAQRPRRCPGGRRIAVSGRAPAGARVLVRLQRGARTVAHRRTRARRGLYRVRFDPRRSGRFSARVVASTRSGKLRASSRGVRVRVR